VADMSEYIGELECVADALGNLVAEYDSLRVRGQLGALEEAVDAVEKAWSKSNLGYHARVYFQDFGTPAPTKMFDPMYGLEADKYERRNLYWVLYNEEMNRAGRLGSDNPRARTAPQNQSSAAAG
jgi:hypothetical protein